MELERKVVTSRIITRQANADLISKEYGIPSSKVMFFRSLLFRESPTIVMNKKSYCSFEVTLCRETTIPAWCGYD